MQIDEEMKTLTSFNSFFFLRQKYVIQRIAKINKQMAEQLFVCDCYTFPLLESTSQRKL